MLKKEMVGVHDMHEIVKGYSHVRDQVEQLLVHRNRGHDELFLDVDGNFIEDGAYLVCLGVQVYRR